MQIIDGKKIADEILQKAKTRIAKQQLSPRLDIIFVGENQASATYVVKKQEAGKKVGVAVTVHKFSQISEAELTKLVLELNQDDKVNGIVIQLPVPNLSKKNKVFEQISLQKDVDGLNPLTQGKLWVNGDVRLLPATTWAISEVIHRIERALDHDFDTVETLKKHVVIINRSILIGKPLAALLLLYNYTVTIAHSETRNLAELANKADILVSATGKADFITADMVKKGAIVIDASFTKEDGKIYGDVNPDTIAGKASWLCPVPNGIGPIGVAMLINNSAYAAAYQKTPNL
ncbi:MAG TPA: bifunctional 5,10-methylenetetrahydrofolate dehydrogenase/5,10-methenyltetrahydrofolate cyclohydrolase [Candidatus Dojkabacteria bacterium]|nr:bifunctional 5,10-methylenetetrahydrofolate dehydrogenase/5,10-methenyltetrahydrofolate cyclohydrolase [Candidatus Dojkabacteria bacterium]